MVRYARASCGRTGGPRIPWPRPSLLPLQGDGSREKLAGGLREAGAADLGAEGDAGDAEARGRQIMLTKCI